MGDTPNSLVSAENTLADTKNFQSSLENLIKVLENAATIAQKMSHHEHADITVASFRMRWENTHKISKQWVNCINELVECWSQLEGKIEELTKWVDASKSSDPGAQAGLSIDKLEEQLNYLKVNFKEKQGMVESMNKICKGKLAGRRKSQVLMNVRRMTMLPVEEMRKLSQMVANQPEEYPDVPAEEDKKEAGEEAKEGEKTDGDVSVSATIKLAPPAETPEAAAEPAPES